jgi:hypothetical protein
MDDFSWKKSPRGRLFNTSPACVLTSPCLRGDFFTGEVKIQAGDVLTKCPYGTFFQEKVSAWRLLSTPLSLCRDFPLFVCRLFYRGKSTYKLVVCWMSACVMTSPVNMVTKGVSWMPIGALRGWGTFSEEKKVECQGTFSRRIIFTESRPREKMYVSKTSFFGAKRWYF